MRNFLNKHFEELLLQIKNTNSHAINISMKETDLIFLKYFFINNFYYAEIVDEYFFKINDKESLIEAIYYQAKLITMHDLNWDALQEGMSDALNNFLEFNGILLIFKKGKILQKELVSEFNMMTTIVEEINRINVEKKIKLLIN